jgi:hypothetical protein
MEYKSQDIPQSLHVGVGRANNSNNVGNANNVYGSAASTISPIPFRDFADDNKNGRTQQPTAECKSSVVTQTGLWQVICNPYNIRAAVNAVMGYVEPEAHKEKLSPQHIQWLENRDELERQLSEHMSNEDYIFAPYANMEVYEPKRRTINYHSDWVDNVKETAVLNIVAPIFIQYFSERTFGSIKGRGTTNMLKHLEAAVRANPNAYFIQLDCRKYYQSIDKEILKQMIRELFSDHPQVRDFILYAVDSYQGAGIPIGIPLSQFNGNLFLTPIDKLLEQDEAVIYSARNMDDIAAIVTDKYEAKRVLAKLSQALAERNLSMKPNWRIAPLSYGMDILGYKIYPTHTKLRKHIKQHMKRRHRQLIQGNVPNKVYKQQMSAFYGWCKHGDCRHLLQSVMGDKLKLYMKYKRLSDLRPSMYFGLNKERFVSITTLDAKELLILECKQDTVKGQEKVIIRFCFTSDIGDEPTEEELANKSHYTITRSDVIRDRLQRDKALIPFAATFHVGKYTYYE